jgi:hypothetical protein
MSKVYSTDREKLNVYRILVARKKETIKEI